jgi:hypothetical protein
MRPLFREPLLHFIVIAALLLALDAATRRSRKPLVEFTAAAVEAQAEASARQLGRPLTPDERRDLIDRMLQDEILFLEARKRGMVADNQVRGTLVAMMRSALKPVTAEPTGEELEALRATLPRESTTLPEQIAFDHVSFTAPEKVPAGLLDELRGGADPKAFGEPLRLANPFPPTYRPQLERLLGKDFAQQVFVQPPGDWRGPLASSLGMHFIRVTTRQPEQPLPLESIKPLLLGHWNSERQDDAVSKEVEKLKAGYRIVLPAAAPTKGDGK